MNGAHWSFIERLVCLTVKVILPLPWVSKVRKTYFTYIPTSDMKIEGICRKDIIQSAVASPPPHSIQY